VGKFQDDANLQLMLKFFEKTEKSCCPLRWAPVEDFVGSAVRDGEVLFGSADASGIGGSSSPSAILALS
jgi:hypothetical protein